MQEREILFRGKRKKGKKDHIENFYGYTEGEWAYGYYIPLKDGDSISHYIYCVAEIAPKTLGRYTGLTDKNNKKIFEGDIVKFAKNLYQITFECGSFALFDKQGLMISKIGGINDHCYSLMRLHLECCWEEDWAYDIEVIGNIHDNPEILKEQEQ